MAKYVHIPAALFRNSVIEPLKSGSADLSAVVHFCEYCIQNHSTEEIEPDIELECCPYCGGLAEIIVGNDCFFVQCAECTSTSGEYSTPEAAADAWNKRA